MLTAFLVVPVDCKVSPWSEWTRHGGQGISRRARYVINYPLNGGKKCPLLNEHRRGENIAREKVRDLTQVVLQRLEDSLKMMSR